MTFIQPNKENSTINKILIVLGISLFLSAVWLVIIYNNLVNLDHGISKMNAEFQLVQSENAQLKDKIFNLVDISSLNGLATKTDLVKDKNPKYFEINQQWSFASQY